MIVVNGLLPDQLDCLVLTRRAHLQNGDGLTSRDRNDNPLRARRLPNRLLMQPVTGHIA
jgi:hypothetical protein